MTYPEFATFFAATHRGLAPLPWQDRLANEVVDSGWPAEIGIPTGLGKTTCLDIAVWALGHPEAQHNRRRLLPTRIWYVVNRRLLVDVAYEQGRQLAKFLTAPNSITAYWAEAQPAHVGAVELVAKSLRQIGSLGDESETEPLTITRLRGGAELGARPPHPAQPAVLFATVPMFASSWLFRGHASSRSMRPIDAAHAGIDSLVLLDEAHLARPLAVLASTTAACDIGDPGRVLPAGRDRPTFVALTATGDAAEPFLLDDNDRANPVVRQRLDATKPVRLLSVPSKASELAQPLVEALADLLAERQQPCACVVFVNRPAMAREVFDGLDDRFEDIDKVLLTGRMRRRESELARQQVLDPVTGAPSGRDRNLRRSRHLVVVATQTLEVGADLDFDVLVTESCGRRALVQRLGRLNRLGSIADAAAAIVHPTKEQAWGIYGVEPADLWDRLLDSASGGGLDLGPGTISGIVGQPEDTPPRVGELLPAHLWEWAKTSTPPVGEAPVELFYDGFDSDGPRVAICWRAHRNAPGERLVPNVVIDETVDLPLYEARQTIADSHGDGTVINRLASDRVTIETCTPRQLRPGDIVILPTSDGFYDHHGWSPRSTGTVLDLSLTRTPLIPLDPTVIEHWAPDAIDTTAIIEALNADDADEYAIATTAVEQLRSCPGIPELADDWATLVDQLRPEIHWTTSPDLPWLIRDLPRRHRAEQLIAADAFDDLSATAQSVGLADHLSSVGTVAARIAEQLSLPPELVDGIEAAGRFHDLGKADPRFQRWLRGSPISHQDESLAKSGTPWWRWQQDRVGSGWPSGGRHEAISGRMVRQWLTEYSPHLDDLDLVIHLVLSHHGHARPLVPPAVDPAPAECSWTIEGNPVTVWADLSDIDWSQPARFRACCERYGYWGLALAEAILRQADHLVSQVAVA